MVVIITEEENFHDCKMLEVVCDGEGRKERKNKRVPEGGRLRRPDRYWRATCTSESVYRMSGEIDSSNDRVGEGSPRGGLEAGLVGRFTMERIERVPSEDRTRGTSAY